MGASILTETKSGKLVTAAQGMAGTKLHQLLVQGESIVNEDADGTQALSASILSACTQNGLNLLKLKEDRRTAGGLAVACDGDLIAISGTCTGTNLYFFDQITRPDVPFTLHIQVLAGSSTGAGMYFTPDTLVAFKTQTRYFSNGAPDWKGTSLWLTNNTILPTILPAVYGRRRVTRLKSLMKIYGANTEPAAGNRPVQHAAK